MLSEFLPTLHGNTIQPGTPTGSKVTIEEKMRAARIELMTSVVTRSGATVPNAANDIATIRHVIQIYFSEVNKNVRKSCLV